MKNIWGAEEERKQDDADLGEESEKEGESKQDLNYYMDAVAFRVGLDQQLPQIMDYTRSNRYPIYTKKFHYNSLELLGQ